MTPGDIDLNLLTTLDILFEERSVSKTAGRLRITQAAVSAQLARLRDHFGDPLFVSSGRGVAPTAFVHEISGEVQELIGRLRALTAMRQSFDPASARRRFRIAAGDIDTFLLVSRLSHRLSRLAPGIKIAIGNPTADHRRGDLFIKPMGIHRPDLPTVPLYRDRYVCLIDRDHPVFGDAVTETEYLAATHIVRRDGATDAPSLEMALMKQKGIRRIEGPVVDAYASIPFLLVGSPYVTTVPFRFAELMSRLFPLRIVELPFPFPDQTLALQWHTIAEQDLATLWLRDQTLAVAREIYGPVDAPSPSSEASAASRKRRSAQSFTAKSRSI